MRIAINAQLLSYSDTYRNGGISRYIRHLLTAIARQPGQHEYTVFVNGQETLHRLRQEQESAACIEYIAVDWPENRPISRVAWEQRRLPALLRERRIEVFHSPANVLPEMLPRECAGVVTLHDMAFLLYPQVLTRAKRAYHRIFTMRSLRRATMIITVSHSTKEDAIKLAGIAPERIQTVYPCIDARFSNVITNEAKQNFRREHGLEGGYLLYLGTLEPRKNIPALLEAYRELRAVYSHKEKLVLVGGKGWLYHEIFGQAQKLGLASEVLFPGYVSNEEQLLWYHGASAFAYPSLYEGFGLPVAESLACGVPVVTSNVSSLPEAGGDIALMVDPHDSHALAAALQRALTDEALRQRCGELAPTVFQRFSAETMAQQTIAVYEQAAALHHRPRHQKRNVTYAR
ncbi:MAG TPA: glycosyltransferase family 1 protein [Ktedonobacteraceae bacterium]|nr:glycosyltransferase family 1 protein [Ktedonobacteraceae bacterium]